MSESSSDNVDRGAATGGVESRHMPVIATAAATALRRRHLPVIAATAATIAQRQVRLRRVAVVAAATAATALAGRLPRGRRVILLRDRDNGPWVTRGRVRAMMPHRRDLP